MKVLVTGSEGRIGRRIAPLLRQQGFDVQGFDAVTGGDLRDFAQVREAARGVEMIVHAGAIAHDREGQEEAVFATNAQATWNVLLAAVEEKITRVVHFSSVNALGAFGGRRPPLYFPIDDAYPHHPLTPYQIAKHLSEETCRAFCDRWGMEIVSFRPVLVSDSHYYERWERVQQGDGPRKDFWSYVDVEDVADATLLALQTPFTGYHALLLASDDTMLPEDSAALIAEHYPAIPWRVSHEEWFAENPNRTLVDCSAAKNLLGWQPKRRWQDMALNAGIPPVPQSS